MFWIQKSRFAKPRKLRFIPFWQTDHLEQDVTFTWKVVVVCYCFGFPVWGFKRLGHTALLWQFFLGLSFWGTILRSPPSSLDKHWGSERSFGSRRLQAERPAGKNPLSVEAAWACHVICALPAGKAHAAASSVPRFGLGGRYGHPTDVGVGQRGMNAQRVFMWSEAVRGGCFLAGSRVGLKRLWGGTGRWGGWWEAR